MARKLETLNTDHEKNMNLLGLAQESFDPSLIRISRYTGDKVFCHELRTLNELELNSIYALLAYVADNQNVAQDTVQHIVTAQFGVNDVTKLRENDYDFAIRFLVDLRLDEMRN